MPRRRKAPATQPVKVPTGMPYGQGQQMQESMAAMPLGAAPDISAMQPGSPPVGGQPGPPGPGLVPAAVTAAQATDIGPGLLTEGVDNAGPLTAGLPMGPGPGTEVLSGLSQANVFQELARTTGDPRFLHLAQQARLTR